jgi:hypothetical protein
MALAKQPASPDYDTEVDRGERVDIPTNNVRQGVTDHNVRRVLAISTVAVVVMLGIVYLLFFAG